MTTWIDFKTLKEVARFEPILEHYGIELKPRGKELVGKCPFHAETKGSFGVNPEKRVFHCFGCDAKGNVLDFVSKKEGIGLKEAAALIADWLGLTEELATTAPAKRERQSQTATRPRERRARPSAAVSAPSATDELNKPLAFSLKLDTSHPYLVERGMTPELVATFGVGYCDRGLLKGRIAIPLHADGQLVGYVGRWASDDVPEGEERYKLPPGLRKNLLLFNVHRVRGAEHVVVVEGCWSVFRLHALGVAAVALLGRSLSPEQEALLVESSAKRITVLLDGDKPGRDAAAELLPRLARRFFTRIAELPDGGEPDTIEEAELVKLLAD